MRSTSLPQSVMLLACAAFAAVTLAVAEDSASETCEMTGRAVSRPALLQAERKVKEQEAFREQVERLAKVDTTADLIRTYGDLSAGISEEAANSGKGNNTAQVALLEESMRLAAADEGHVGDNDSAVTGATSDSLSSEAARGDSDGEMFQPDDEESSGDVAQPTIHKVAKISPFGKEDTARELQVHASSTQDTLVDAIENAEVAEIKRSVFRSLTKLRAAQIKEFDTIARLETQAIDEYNDRHTFREENPLNYLHDNEPAVSKDKYTSFHE